MAVAGGWLAAYSLERQIGRANYVAKRRPNRQSEGYTGNQPAQQVTSRSADPTEKSGIRECVRPV
jgi:hypothetical protein